MHREAPGRLRWPDALRSIEIKVRGTEGAQTVNQSHTRILSRGRLGTTVFLCALAGAAVTTVATAQESTALETPLSDAIRNAPEDVQEYNEHLVILSSPWMEGRLPGTRGMELAKEYVERYFIETGLEAPVLDEDSGSYGYRQPFRLGGTTEFVDQELMVGDTAFTQGKDFEMTGLGTNAGISAPLSFAGYSIARGPDDYTSYGEDDDLTGRIVVVFRFEPMDEDGNSLWSTSNWSSRATFSEKFNALIEHDPAGVILVNPPGANDPRARELMTRAQRMTSSAPVFMMTPAAAERLLQASGDKRTIMEWRQLADSGEGGVVHLDGPMVTMQGQRENIPLMGENVVGVLPGRGDLKDEYVVIGAHLDHLGMGDFGSRSNERALHPGADDNASGSVAVMMLGDSLSKAYQEADPDQPLRSIVLMCFDGEESGLNGSRHYVNNPIYPVEDHVLMINFDMIGRIEDGRLSVSGTGTGEGMSEWAQPIFDDSDLDIVVSEGSGGGSDHSSFLGVNVPVLFGITPFPLHNDYHTPQDTPDKINREGAVQTIYLFHELAFDAAKRPERFAFAGGGGRRGGGGAGGRVRNNMPKVMLGVRSTTDEGEPGLRIVVVREGLSAEKAGLKEGDRLLKFNEQELDTRRDLIDQLMEQEPGATVEAIVLRDDKEMVIEIELMGRDEPENG